MSNYCSETNPLFSIITPSFNCGAYLPRLAEAVFGQTFENFEWIVVDDGSNDGTLDFLESIKEPRLKIVSQSNAGVSSARNRALSVATGIWVFFVDSDDLIPMDSLALFFAEIEEHPSADVVSGAITIASESGDSSKRLLCSSDDWGADLLRLDPKRFVNVGVCIRRSTIGEQRFNESLSHGEDLEFFIGISRPQRVQFHAFQAATYIYRQRADSAMTNLRRLACGYLTLAFLILPMSSASLLERLGFSSRCALLASKIYIRSIAPQ